MDEFCSINGSLSNAEFQNKLEEKKKKAEKTTGALNLDKESPVDKEIQRMIREKQERQFE